MITEVEQSFFELTGRRLDNVSYLHMFKILQEFSGEKYLNIWRSYSMNTDLALYKTYIVQTEDWWDAISKRMYGTEYLWWAICLSNNIINPFEELEAGQEVKILLESSIYQLLKDLKSISSL